MYWSILFELKRCSSELDHDSLTSIFLTAQRRKMLSSSSSTSGLINGGHSPIHVTLAAPIMLKTVDDEDESEEEQEGGGDWNWREDDR